MVYAALKPLFRPTLRLTQSPWFARIVQGLLWLLLGAGLAYGYVVFSRPPAIVVPLVGAGVSAQYRADRGPEGRLFGVDDLDGRTVPNIQVMGVVATTSGQGSAVVSVDGQPAIAAVRGGAVGNGWTVSDVFPDGVVISRQGRQHRLAAPAQPPVEQLIVTAPAGR
ncbi:MAG: type II secretion system protein N [Burkholderiaceae bacterium]